MLPPLSERVGSSLVKILSRRSTMKALAALAVAVIGLSSPASAQTRVMTEHAATASALGCLLDQQQCRQGFARLASLAPAPSLGHNPARDSALGALVSWEYVGTQPANAYTTKFLNGRTADVYQVKFRHGVKTFYLVPPGPDGNIRYMHIRNGGPNDERGGLRAFE
jgi:hypothetical protein